MTTTEKLPLLIAEIGCNHGGSMDTAREMITVAAKYCHVDVVKFQKRDVSNLPPEVENRPYESAHSFGKTYGEHRRALEFSMAEHYLLAEHCRAMGVEYSTSVWDMASAVNMTQNIACDMIKVPSARNQDYEMIDWLVDRYKGDIHLSMGMTTFEEKHEIIAKMQEWGPHRFVMYHCTSAYPMRFEEASMRLITWYTEMAGFRVGYSGHHKGIALDMVALGMGADYIERHFTLDRTSKGTDHAASLEPDGMRKLRRDMTNIDIALKNTHYGIHDGEIPNREKLK